MKYQLLIALVLLGIGLGTIILAEEDTDPQMPPLPPGAVKLTFSWDYPEEDMSEELFFNLYMSTDVRKPLQEWDLLATIKGTNTKAVIYMVPGKYFVAVSANDAQAGRKAKCCEGVFRRADCDCCCK